MSPPAINALKTHCIRGHKFDSENTRLYRGERICRICSKVIKLKWNKKNPNYYNDRYIGLKESNDPRFRELQVKNSRLRRLRFPNKAKARCTLYRAVKNGRIDKPTICSECLCTGRIEGHHYMGYDNPLTVVWLCPQCHHNSHKTLDSIEKLLGR